MLLICREDIESVERRRGDTAGDESASGKFGREVCCFNVGVVKFAARGMTGCRAGGGGGRKVGEVGGEVQDCVRRWDSRDGAREVIDG